MSAVGRHAGAGSSREAVREAAILWRGGAGMYEEETDSRVADLKKHIRVVHNNERNFVCPVCSKGFGEKGYV